MKAYTVTKTDLIDTELGCYYTGPLKLAKKMIRKQYAVTVSDFVNQNETRVHVMFAINGERATDSNCNDFGNGPTSEVAWRYALGAEFGPLDDEFAPFTIYSNKATPREIIDAVIDAEFPDSSSRFYAEDDSLAAVEDKEGNMWRIWPDSTYEKYTR